MPLEFHTFLLKAEQTLSPCWTYRLPKDGKLSPELNGRVRGESGVATILCGMTFINNEI